MLPISLLKLAGQGIRLSVVGPRAAGHGEVELNEEQGPASLSGVESLGRADIFKVLVIHQNQKWHLNAFQLVSPFFQRQFYCEQFPIANVIVPLSQRQTPREEGAGMDLRVSSRPLGKDSPKHHV